MGIIFAALIIWCIGSLIFAALAPIAGQLLLFFFKFIGLCIGITLRLVWVALRWSATDGRRHVIAAARAAFVFASILWDAWHEEIAESMAEDAGPEGAAEPAMARPDPFQAACALLGLTGNFTPAELSRVYRQAIRKAHPDAGGSHAQAAAINAARDLIIARMGWAAS